MIKRRQKQKGAKPLVKNRKERSCSSKTRQRWNISSLINYRLACVCGQLKKQRSLSSNPVTPRQHNTLLIISWYWATATSNSPSITFICRDSNTKINQGWKHIRVRTTSRVPTATLMWNSRTFQGVSRNKVRALPCYILLGLVVVVVDLEIEAYHQPPCSKLWNYLNVKLYCWVTLVLSYKLFTLSQVCQISY